MSKDGWDTATLGKVMTFLFRLAIFLLIVFFVIRTFVVVYETHKLAVETNQMVKELKSKK